MSNDDDTKPRGTSKADWQPRIDALEARRVRARAMGGTEKLEKRAALGELSARARIEALLDPGSFRELGTLETPILPPCASTASLQNVKPRPVSVFRPCDLISAWPNFSKISSPTVVSRL